MTDNEYKNWAFLSYSPQDNREQRTDSPAASHRCWGDWLNDALKSFSIPAEFVGQINGRGEIIPERIEPVFRDESELSDGTSLSAEVRAALEQSRCLVVVCSPRSAQSRQVNEVVRYFKQLGRGQQILPVVIAGEPNVADDNSRECFVPALRHPVLPDGTIDTARRAGKSIFVDARHGFEKREILANDQRRAEADLEMAKIQLIALLLGVGFNGLWWREQNRHFIDLTEARQQAREAQNQVEEARRQLQAAQEQVRAAQNQALEKQNLPGEIQGQILAAQNQAQEAQQQTREAQKQVRDFQNQVRETQAQLEAARDRALAAENKFLEAQQQVRSAQTQLDEIRQQDRAAQDAQGQITEAQNQVRKIQGRSRNARRLAKVFAVLAVLAALAAAQAWRERKAASLALAEATAEAAGNFNPVIGGMEPVRQTLQKIGGAEQAENRQRSLDQLATGIPVAEISNALSASAVIVDDWQRSHFQKWLLLRLGWANPVAAMSYAGAIDGKVVNDVGAEDSVSYFQSAILDNWIRSDWPAAFKWLCQLPDSEAKNKMLTNCINELAKTNLPRAVTVTESLPKGIWRSTMMTSLLNGVPSAIMQPRAVVWPWTGFLRDVNLDCLTIFPVETEMFSTTTNNPVKVQLPE